MSLKQFIGKMLPPDLKLKLKRVEREFSRKSIIRKWIEDGRPVPPPHEIKQDIISEYKQQYNSQVLIETGTYLGDMIAAQKNNFNRIYSVELSKMLWEKAVKRFKNAPHIQILLGDSAVVLKEIVPSIQEPAIFWLDGHYSAGITAKGNTDCPIYDELNTILSSDNNINHVILIDDAREFIGQGDYPKIEDILKFVQSKKPAYKMEVKYDVIRFTV